MQRNIFAIPLQLKPTLNVKDPIQLLKFKIFITMFNFLQNYKHKHTFKSYYVLSMLKVNFPLPGNMLLIIIDNIYLVVNVIYQ